jgi:ribonuclease R
LFVRLPALAADGLVHVTALPRDYYHRDAAGTTLTGERSGHVYRLMDTLKVRLVAVNVEERKVDFVPAELEGAAPERQGRPGRQGPQDRKGQRGRRRGQ